MIGALRYKIQLLQRTESPDEAGGAAAAYAPVADIWSAVERTASVIGAGGGRDRPLRRLRVWIRSRPDASLNARIRFEGADYKIVSVESDDARGRRLFLICEEVL